jgi:hypothetical protein
MRTLNDLCLPAGVMAAINTGSLETDHVAVPDTGRLYSVFCHTEILIAAAHSFDIFVNDVDSGVDCDLPDATPADSGVEMVVPSEVHLEPGDQVYLQSNNEQTTADTICYFTFVIRR